MKIQAGYKYLLTYRYSKIIYDLNFAFIQRFLFGRENLRNREQMEQAARSGKQNIAEGYMERSLKSYIKLLGVARASLEELLEDYEDFSRKKKIRLWEMGEWRERKNLRIFLKPNPPDPPPPPLPKSPEIATNLLIDIIKRNNYLLDKQIASLERRFVEEGGYTENLFRKRLKKREG